MGSSIRSGSGYALGVKGGGGGPGTNTNDAVLLFGAGTVGASQTVRYLYPGYDDNLAQTVVIEMVAPYAGTLRFFYVRHNAAGGNGNAVDYEVLVNGAATGITVNLATGAIGQGSDLANTFAVVAGDRIGIEVTKASNVGAGAVDVAATLDLKVA
jgi:hypothetical protein